MSVLCPDNEAMMQFQANEDRECGRMEEAMTLCEESYRVLFDSIIVGLYERSVIPRIEIGVVLGNSEIQRTNHVRKQ